jgi:hypothetical protein
MENSRSGLKRQASRRSFFRTGTLGVGAAVGTALLSERLAAAAGLASGPVLRSVCSRLYLFGYCCVREPSFHRVLLEPRWACCQA